MKKRNLLLIGFVLFAFGVADAQNFVYETFKDRRVINNHSVETLPARKLDIRIGHRFGNFLGETGGWPTFYGLENSTDIFSNSNLKSVPSQV